MEDIYPATTTLTDGYYRESMKENGVFIKYTDAAATYRAAP